MYTRSPTELALFVMNQRKKLGLTQDQVGKLVGLKQKTISAFENNPENTKVSTLFKILSGVCFDLNLSPKKAKNTKWKEEW